MSKARSPQPAPVSTTSSRRRSTLANVDDWGKFNDIYKEIFQPPYPTRTAIGANLRGILVEISAVAYVRR